MRRRDVLIGMTASPWPLFCGVARAQVPNKIYRLGHLANSEVSERSTRDITLPELANLGFVEGRNLVFDGRVGPSASLPDLMKELLAARPDAVIAVGPAGIAAASVVKDTPIVTFGGDPTELGLAQSYAKPGGNVTGVVILISELEVKRLSLLREAVPDRRRVAALVPLSAESTSVGETAMRKASAGLGIELLSFPAASPADYPAAFAAMKAAGAQALIISATTEFFRDGKVLAQLALETGLPTVCEWAEMAHMGCLIGYGPNRTELRKRMAAQVAQIFRGASPADIAIERPAVFESAVNQKVAKALGVTIPDAVLARADEVIE